MLTAPKTHYFWPLLVILFLADCTTKDLILDRLDTPGAPRAIVGSFLRFKLAQNPGTAFGYDFRPMLGAWARPVLVLGMLAMLAVLLRVYWLTAPRARLAAAALGLACGGALGNLFDRLRFPGGVVDFIDVGIGPHRFWLFNVADAGVSVGAMLLAIVLLRDEAGHSAGRGAGRSRGQARAYF